MANDAMACAEFLLWLRVVDRDPQDRPGRLALAGGRGGRMTEDIDREDPRPAERYHVEADSTWYYVNDDLAKTIATGPATDADPGDDWILSFTAGGATADDRERVCVQLTPRALHELYIETKDLSADNRMAGHSGKCALCGDQVDFDRAIPDGQGAPTHRRCWADAYGAPDWFLEVG